MTNELSAVLFPQTGESTYVVMDGASCEDLLPKLDEFQPEYVCLYAGELEPDVEEVAPYLIRLEADIDFTRWLLEEGWGKHWGVFATASADLRTLRKHLRTLLLVKHPDGKTLYFRYYDPRVLATYLPTLNSGERSQVYGMVNTFFYETASGDSINCVSFDGSIRVVRLPDREETPLQP